MESVLPTISGKWGIHPPTLLRVGKLDELIFIWYENFGRSCWRERASAILL